MLPVASVCAFTVLSCRAPQAANPPPSLGSVEPEVVDPAYREAWDAVRDAAARDAAGADVLDAADRLLEQNPPASLEVAARHAKGAQAYAVGDDPRAVQELEAALSDFQPWP